jgi:imidazole glycerol phosphate synthase subunit HisF
MEIVEAYFRAGADKVSIGSDAVLAAEAFWRDEGGRIHNTELLTPKPKLVKLQ